MALQAGLSVGFSAPGANGDGPSGYLSAEIDDRENGLNGGRTSFAPGDTVYFFVFKSNNVNIESVTASAGSVYQEHIAIGGDGSLWLPREVEVQFVNTDRATLPLPAFSIESYEWLGRNMGGLRLIDEQIVEIVAPSVAVARLRVLVRGWPWRLVTPVVSLADNEEYPIIVHVQGEYR